MTTELTTIPEYTKSAQGLAELRRRLGSLVYDVTTTKGMTEAKKDRAIARELRINLEAERVRIKAPALERCRAIDAEAKRLTAEIVELEDPIDQAVKAEESRKEREKAERERIVAEKVDARNRRFDAIRAQPLRAVNATAAQIEQFIAEAEAVDVSDFDGVTLAAAKHERLLAIAALRAALDARRLEDVKAEQVRKDLEELDRLRAERAAQQAEADRLAAAERDRVAAEARKLEDQARAERESTDKAAREARQAEQARIDAERAEQRRKEDAERKAAADKLAKDQAEAAAERKRLADLAVATVKAAKEKAIADATLLSAANEAVELLAANGLGDHVVTLKLRAAIGREPHRL